MLKNIHIWINITNLVPVKIQELPNNIIRTAPESVIYMNPTTITIYDRPWRWDERDKWLIQVGSFFFVGSAQEISRPTKALNTLAVDCML